MHQKTNARFMAPPSSKIEDVFQGFVEKGVTNEIQKQSTEALSYLWGTITPNPREEGNLLGLKRGKLVGFQRLE